MKNKTHLWISVLLFMAAFAPRAFADSPEVYVKNQKIGVAVKKTVDVYFLPLESFKKALHLDLAVDASGKLVVNKKTTSIEALKVNHTWYLPVREVGEYLGYDFQYNPNASINLFQESAPAAIAAANGENAENRISSMQTLVHKNVINKGQEGKEIKIESFLVPGKTNIFAFYSAYCGACQSIIPQIESKLENRKDVALLLLDINRPEVRGIDWASPLAKEYQVQSTPDFKIYDGSGKLVAEGTEATKKVGEMVFNVAPQAQAAPPAVSR